MFELRTGQREPGGDGASRVILTGYIQRVRYFLTRGHRPVTSILLVESGSRELLERALVPLRRIWGDQVFIDLVTCYSGLPAGFVPETTRVYRVSDYRGRQSRRGLYRELAKNKYALVGIVCSGQPLMTKWKWALALRLPAKVFIINENADYFPLEIGEWNNVRRFVLSRAGLGGAGAVRTLARVISFPFTLLYLLLYATTVHTRRTVRRG